MYVTCYCAMQISGSHADALSMISMIGCIVSIVSLLLTVFLYLAMWKYAITHYAITTYAISNYAISYYVDKNYELYNFLRCLSRHA